MSACAKVFNVDTNFISKSSETDILGRQKTENPFENKQKALQLLGGIKERIEFEEVLFDSDLEYLKESYARSKGTDNDIFTEFSLYNRIPIMIIEDGNLADITNSNKEYLEEVITEPSNSLLLNSIDFLLELDTNVAEINRDKIQVVLDETLDSMVDIGIDTSFQKGKSLQENKLLLEAVADYLQFQDNDSFNNLVQEYDKISPFKVETTKVLRTSVDSEYLVYLDTAQTEYDLYKNQGLIKVDDNVYMRTAEQSLEEMYDNLYKRKDILPKKNTVVQQENLFSKTVVENTLTEGIEIEELTAKEIEEKKQEIDKNSLPNLDIPDLNVIFVTNKVKLSEKVEEEVVSPSGIGATREVTNKVIQDRLRQKKKELDEVIKCHNGG